MIALALLAFGLVLIIEGLAYALAPSFIERMLEVLRSLPLNARRQVGAIALITGVILVWIASALGLAF